MKRLIDLLSGFYTELPHPLGQKWDKLTLILSTFIIISGTVPFLYGIFLAHMTLHDHFSYFEFTLANAMCPLDTNFACRFITFILLATHYGYLAYHSTACLIGAVINSAVVLNMVIYSLNNLARMSPSIHSFRIYQRFYILNKTMETMSTLLASLWISFGFIFSVTCNFVSVRMYRVIPMPFYLVFPVGSLGATVAIMVLFPYGIACHDVSSELLEGWRMKLKMKRGSTSMRDLVKLGDALRPVGIRVGSGEFSFFMIKNSTKSKYYVSVTDYTINALLS